MDDLKLLRRSDDDLENEIKIVKAIGKDINTNFGLEKCAKICLKKAKYIMEAHLRRTLNNWIREKQVCI
jgi:hypothetical protein